MCNNDGSCISKLLEKILLKQSINCNIQEGCNKPFLGSNGTDSNTKPLNLYSCCSGSIWIMPYNYNNEAGESTTFRIESIVDNYATFRILIPTENGYTFTDNYFTIDLKNISCIKCLDDNLLNI